MHPLQVTSRPLPDGFWCVETRSKFGEVFCVPQLTMSNDGASLSDLRFIFHLFVQSSSPPSLRKDICMKYTTGRG